ncbi:MAG: ipaA [Herbaspirillum sp.]|nr:ipaA [Herbaspirillum sp.]
MKISDDGISRSRASSVSSNDGTRLKEDTSQFAREFIGAASVIKGDGDPAFAAGSQSEKQAMAADLLDRSRANSFQERTGPAQGKERSRIGENIVGVSNADPAEPVSVSDGTAKEPEDVSTETAVKEIAVEENTEDAGATAEPYSEPLDDTENLPTSEQLLARFACLRDKPEINSGTDLWERTVDREIADRVDIAEELADVDFEFESQQVLNGILDGGDPLEDDELERNAQVAAGKRRAFNGPAADPTPGASTGAPGGAAAAAQPAPSSAVENLTCASQFGEESLKTFFEQGSVSQAKRLSDMFAAGNAYAKLTVEDFAALLKVSLDKIRNSGLPEQEQQLLLAPLKSLAQKYIELILDEKLDKESAFGAFYLGHKDQRNLRLNLEAELVALSGGESAEGRTALQNIVLEHTVLPFIDAHLKEMFGGNPNGNTSSLAADIIDARAKEALNKIGEAAENYSKKHRASVRGLAFGFSLVTLWPELLRKLLDDGTSAAAQTQNPAVEPAENGDPSPSFLPPAPVGGPPSPTPAGSPEPAMMPDGRGSVAGGGTVIHGDVHIHIDKSDNRSNYNNGGITFGHDGARAAMEPEDDRSDASSESGYSPLTRANLAAHDRPFPGDGIAPRRTSKTSESDSETSESDSEDRHLISRDLLSGDEVDSGIFARRIIEDRSDQGESVAQSLNETSDGNTSSESSGYDSDAKQSEPASRHEISTSTPFPPGSYTFQSALLPFAQGASAIEFVNLDRAAVTNGWAPTVNDDGKQSWKQMLMDKSGELKASEFKKVELTINRDVEGRSGGVKPGARVLPHPWARSQWIRETAAKRMQAENTLMVEEAADAAKPVGQPDFAEQNADAA